MFKSLRYRLLIWFVLSALIISTCSFLIFQFHKTTKYRQQKVLEDLSYFRYQFLKDQTNVANFMISETSSHKFFITGESDYLNAHYKNLYNIDSCFINYNGKGYKKQIATADPIIEIRNTYTDYCRVLDSLVYKIYLRGYKNFGLEGELVSYMYRLENQTKLTPAQISKLKLTEKEYINHYDTNYIQQINTLCSSLITNTIFSNSYTAADSKAIVETIKSYRKAFNDLVLIDREIGVNGNEGLKYQLSELSYRLEDLVNSSIIEANRFYKTKMARINFLFGLLALILISLAVTLSVYTSRYLVRNLEQLTSYINSLSKLNFNRALDFDLRHSTSEVRQIYLEFRSMLSDLRIREKQRDRALRFAEDNQQRYQELADLLPQSIYETDRAGNLTYVNKAWYKTFGYSSMDIDKGINLIEIINTDPNSNLFGFSKVENNDFRAIRKDGSEFPATVFSDVIKKGLRIVGRRGIIIDSSLRNKYIESLKKETVRAITSDKHKSSFLANMSHEIRTPMNSIIGFTNMLASKEIPEEMKDNFIDHIQTSSDMLLNLIDDIIDIAKIEDGQLKITNTDCRPVEIIESLVANFEAYKIKIEKNQIEIKTSLPTDDIFIRTDGFRLKQIISNMMSNAIKFTEEGWIEVGMKVKNQRVLEFYVEDTGIGMSKEDLRTIFERFKRTKLTEELKISGSGLGLSISKNLVELLDGNMWVTSEIGKGTRFIFEIPYIRASNITVPEAIETDNLNINWQNKKFLVAEDDNYGYTYISHILEKTGVELIRARNGNEALEALSFHRDIELVLMDLRMPVLNGLDATRQIKTLYPKLPVIAQTAFAMDGDRNKCLEAGCDDYIKKPIHAESLLAKISQFVQSSEPAEVSPKSVGLDKNKTILAEKPAQKNRGELS
jgi:PAS domain S-box-containing protein